MALVPALSKLPRELRDEIYSHLTTDRVFIWDNISEFNLFPNPLRSPATITFDNAPIPDKRVSLGSLKHEYDEHMSQTRLSATIRAGSYGSPFTRSLGQVANRLPILNGVKNGTALQALQDHFRPVDHVTFLADRGYDKSRYPRYHSPVTWDWEAVRHFIKCTADGHPHYKTFRVAMCWSTSAGLIHDNPEYTTSVQLPDSNSDNNFLSDPPDTLAGLPLVQRDEAYRLYNALPSPEVEDYYDAYYNSIITKVAWYAYGQGACWEDGEVDREWPISGNEVLGLKFVRTTVRGHGPME